MIHLTKPTPDQWALAACALGAGLYFSSASLGQAQIVRDGTVGPGVAIQPMGPHYVIPDSHGARAGTNLFHSFQQFNIKPDQSATFTGPSDIQNVISRVTGPGASTIDGVLRSQVGQANVWLLNPNGVVLGPHARLDVPAAFYTNAPGTTELRFGDGTAWSATSSTLSVAPPEAFGFLPATTPVQKDVSADPNPQRDTNPPVQRVAPSINPQRDTNAQAQKDAFADPNPQRDTNPPVQRVAPSINPQRDTNVQAEHRVSDTNVPVQADRIDSRRIDSLLDTNVQVDKAAPPVRKAARDTNVQVDKAAPPVQKVAPSINPRRDTNAPVEKRNSSRTGSKAGTSTGR